MYDEEDNPLINRALINKIYMDAAERESEGYIKYTREQNVSSDINANLDPAVIIEGNETDRRTAVVTLDISKFFAKGMVPEGVSQNVNIPITQVVVYGWYDNELGSYTNMLDDLTSKIAAKVYH